VSDYYCIPQHRIDVIKATPSAPPQCWLCEQEIVPSWLETAHKMKPGRMLDLGCSTGRIMQLFAEAGWSCVGVDVDADAIRQAVQSGTVFLRKDEEPLSYLQDNSFDLVCAVSVFHHMRDVHGNLSEIVRCTKPGGWLLIDEVVEDSLFIRLGRSIFKQWSGMPILSRLYVEDWLALFAQYNLTLHCAYGVTQWTGLVSELARFMPRVFHLRFASHLAFKKLGPDLKRDIGVHFVRFFVQKPTAMG